ncbi:MAG: CHASE3 domain-containing protein, partial [Pseudobdellovibrionaceae bacterium]|nr:CHASE3 domain-containing protein [Pseudobdellovibrionaceae bacterium]
MISMNIISKRYGVWWSLILLILFAITLAPLYSNYKAGQIKKDWMEERSRFNEIKSIWNHTMEAESSQRGYLLSGSESFLHDYDHALKVIPPMLENIKRFTKINPGEHKMALALDKL